MGDGKLGSVLVVYNSRNKNDELPKKQMMRTFWVAVVFRNNCNYTFYNFTLQYNKKF